MKAIENIINREIRKDRTVLDPPGSNFPSDFFSNIGVDNVDNEKGTIEISLLISKTYSNPDDLTTYYGKMYESSFFDVCLDIGQAMDDTILRYIGMNNFKIKCNLYAEEGKGTYLFYTCVV